MVAQRLRCWDADQNVGGSNPGAALKSSCSTLSTMTYIGVGKDIDNKPTSG